MQCCGSAAKLRRERGTPHAQAAAPGCCGAGRRRVCVRGHARGGAQRGAQRRDGDAPAHQVRRLAWPCWSRSSSSRPSGAEPSVTCSDGCDAAVHVWSLLARTQRSCSLRRHRACAPLVPSGPLGPAAAPGGCCHSRGSLRRPRSAWRRWRPGPGRWRRCAGGWRAASTAPAASRTWCPTARPPTWYSQARRAHGLPHARDAHA